MLLRTILFLLCVCDVIYDFFIMHLNTIQRAKPLPEEVSDIYDHDRYQEFLHYKKDYRPIVILKDVFGLILNAIILLSPFFTFVEHLAHGSDVLVIIYAILLTFIPTELFSLIINDYATFTIEEKYGKNKQTKRSFFKENAIDLLLSLLLYVLIYGGLYLLIHKVLSGVNLSGTRPLFYTIVIIALVAVFMLIIFGISYLYLHLQYKFTPLEDGPLKEDIMGLMKDSKKKVKTINVYNESAKSTSKNAFLLKMPFHKEFGIADNFLNENAHDELLGVLAHEVGHLKHKKNIFNYLQYGAYVIAVLILYLLLSHVGIVTTVAHFIDQSFHITVNNLYLDLLVIEIIFKPLSFLLGFFRNYVSRREEYEADDNAVKEGYGEALISTFKQLSSDEYVDVNPHPLIETLEYDHPGMYHRIKHIEEGVRKSS